MRAKYKKMINELSVLDKLIHINKVHGKHYDFVVNFEIIKSFKQRQSCNKRIIKLYEKTKIQNNS